MQLEALQRAKDFSSIGYRVFHSEEIYERERTHIFAGNVWNYVCLDIEVPEPGSFITTYVGDIPVLVNRTMEGGLKAFENRCMHRGTKLKREARGKETTHNCVYHQWCYGLDGGLIGIPFARGKDGKGGVPAEFDRSSIKLREMKLSILKGVVFGSFGDNPPPLEDYLGPRVVEMIENLFYKPIKILGYQRQRIMGNWKLYNENVRDTNHGGLLHMFHATFGLASLSMQGGSRLDGPTRGHNTSYTVYGTDDQSQKKDGYSQTKKVLQDTFQLADPSMLRFEKELPREESLVILSTFPNGVFQQISNSLCTRQIRPRGVNEMELYWTYYGFEDDTPEMTEHRRNQANLVGPGGLVSMEDGEAVQLVHEETKASPEAASRIIIGGLGEIKDTESLITEVPLRGFWASYFKAMDL